MPNEAGAWQQDADRAHPRTFSEHLGLTNNQHIYGPPPVSQLEQEFPIPGLNDLIKKIRDHQQASQVKSQNELAEAQSKSQAIGPVPTIDTPKIQARQQVAPTQPIKADPTAPVRGLRFNTGKTLYHLIPPYPLEQIAKVFTKGAEKYAPNNWKKGMPWSEVEGSLIRHLEAYRSGEDFDSESGLYHMAHVAVNAIFLIDYYRSNPQFDDRFKSYLQLPKVVLDIDEVVCGWAQGYKQHTGKDIQSTYWDSRYGFSKELGELAKNKEFWINLPCIRKPDFVPHAYVSSRSIPVEWTQEWLEKNHLPCRPVHHVPFDASKVEVLKSLGTEYFIDDRFENFREATQAGICTFLMDASHNQHYNVGYRRIKDLQLKNIIR
jgi:hypothetical protein